MTILTISVLGCCRLIVDWRHLCKTLFFFIFVYGPGRALIRPGRAEISQVVNRPGREISARAEFYTGEAKKKVGEARSSARMSRRCSAAMGDGGLRYCDDM